MPNPTIAAGYPKAFLDFAVSKGADRQTLLDRSEIPLADLSDLEKRIPLSNYVTLLQAGIELCREPAIALLFGEAVNGQNLSIAGLMGRAFAFDSIESARQQIDRYSPLALDTDDAAATAIEMVRENGDVALKFTWKVYVDYPLLTESALRAYCLRGTATSGSYAGVCKHDFSQSNPLHSQRARLPRRIRPRIWCALDL